jgi:hypothetical protein
MRREVSGVRHEGTRATCFGLQHRLHQSRSLRARRCIEFGNFLVGLTRVGHFHLTQQTHLAFAARIRFGGIDLSAETQFSSIRWRAEAAPAYAPNAAWLARTKLHWLARSVR